MNKIIDNRILFHSNFNVDTPYLLRKLRYPESTKYLPNFLYSYVSFILQKKCFAADGGDSIIQEIKITYKEQENIKHKYFIFSNNGLHVYFDTRDQEIDFQNYSRSSSWLMLPFQSHKLGSLIMYECISYRDKFCPALSLSPIALSDDRHLPENEKRRNKLYSNFGYKIEEYKGTHVLPIKYPSDQLFEFERHSLKNYPKNMYDMLDDLFNYSTNSF